jgi:DNA-binding MarR family transcriptional regulator
MYYASGVSTSSTTPPGAQAGDPRIEVGETLSGLVAGVVRRGSRDISLTSLTTLATLHRSGPQRITDLALVEGVTQPSMTALVAILQRDGYVVRRGDPSDKRVALIELTEVGTELLRGRRRANAEAFAQLIERLPSDENAALLAALPALRHLRELQETQRGPATRPYDTEAR